MLATTKDCFPGCSRTTTALFIRCQLLEKGKALTWKQTGTSCPACAFSSWMNLPTVQTRRRKLPDTFRCFPAKCTCLELPGL